MKKLDSTLFNMVTVLTAVAIVMGTLLAWVNDMTAAPIKQQKDKALADGIRSVMRADQIDVAVPDTIQTYVVYRVSDADGQPLGAAVESTTNGFGGPLKVLVGFDTEGNITGYTLLEHQETPGLGAKADTWFQEGQPGDIIGKNPSEPLTVSKDGGEIDAITASTITSRAFLLAIGNAYNAYMKQPADASTGASVKQKEE